MWKECCMKLKLLDNTTYATNDVIKNWTKTDKKWPREMNFHQIVKVGMEMAQNSPIPAPTPEQLMALRVRNF